jgi:hypothetical protein
MGIAVLTGGKEYPLRTFHRRALLVLLLGASPSVAVLALAGPAAAAASATCGALSGKLASPTAHLTGCTGSTTGGAGTLSGSQGIDTVKWKNGGVTTFRLKSNVGKQNHCPTGSTEFYLRGTVTKSTGSATAIKGAVSADLCVTGTPRGKVSLLTGTLFTL